MMFEKMGALINLFRKGNEVANVEVWKAGGIRTGALAAALLALVAVGKTFGLDVPVTSDQATGIAAGIISIVGVVLPLITSKRAGVLPAKREYGLAPIEDHSFQSGVSSMAETATQTAVFTEYGASTNLVTDSDPLAGLDTTYVG
jgi:hypothetical protein